MASRQEWLRILAVTADSDSGIAGTCCPNCRQRNLMLRYIGDTRSRIGYALLWCNSCLHGISVSRVRVPEGVPVYEFDQPEATQGIPEFVREE